MSSELINRRQFVGASTALCATSSTSVLGAVEIGRRPRIAAIITSHGPRTHSDVILSRIWDFYRPNGRKTYARCRVVSTYLDQDATRDRLETHARQKQFDVYGTIPEALTCGTGDLAVDGVLIIGEHGYYPKNDCGQTLYPRYEMFSQVVETFRKCGKTVPVFSDKHLSYSWDKARQMYRWSKELGFPLMAGSSLPFALRRPDMAVEWGEDLEAAVQIGFGGNDSYGCHLLEALQCMAERRRGGETGIKSVQWISGNDVWAWRDSVAGQWTIPLLEQAYSHTSGTAGKWPEDFVRGPVVFVLEYLDGFKAACFFLTRFVNELAFATKTKHDDILSTRFQSHDVPRELPHFDGLVGAIDRFMIEPRSAAPIERNLLTTGALSLLFQSKVEERQIETPELHIRYVPPRHPDYQQV